MSTAERQETTTSGRRDSNRRDSADVAGHRRHESTTGRDEQTVLSADSEIPELPLEVELVEETIVIRVIVVENHPQLSRLQINKIYYLFKTNRAVTSWHIKRAIKRVDKEIRRCGNNEGEKKGKLEDHKAALKVLQTRCAEAKLCDKSVRSLKESIKKLDSVLKDLSALEGNGNDQHNA
ncbi:uncharacterized protein FOMMEDRAFT_159097 [Fomitiporia mediterranea MF3/22]|uniref:uncharacterized protein n=1 Tax=Fomitiporia mediterranea (strain MF3/22) TaxID=694068 RepID=UPI0004407E01|nr:uncharacterized protein FOMMEDRAFT_159097 [Fomitiporia mediterranea MF3/22]EJD00417.1 hypothetical protein FOMMEDRAFT_159097 [Fomitiporia mediterranea MF3/22]